MSSEHSMDTVVLAERARSALGDALEALQSESAGGQLFDVAAPLARALAICAQIAATGDVKAGPGLAAALDSIRRALALLQQPHLQRYSALLERATAGVAQALGALHELDRAEQDARLSAPTLAGSDHVTPLRNEEPRIEATLGAYSATNFYRGLAGDDVVSAGGLFVETYVLPAVGQRLRLHVSLPGGYTFEALGIVAWTREARAGSIAADAPPGFGARLSELATDARQLIQRYVKNREPLFVDD
jgi:hypothetical protein